MRVLLVGSLSVLVASAAGAQTNDGLYRGREWQELAGSPRAIGMGGAFVGVADDYSATTLNPAGLGTLAKSEIGGTFAAYSSATVDPAKLSSSSGLGLVGGAGRLTRKWVLGGFVSRPVVSRRELATMAVGGPVSVGGVGWLEETVSVGGVVGAWSPRRGLHLGMALLLADLRTEGLYTEQTASTQTLDVGIAGGNPRLISSVGALLQVGSARIGFQARTGATWHDVERRASVNAGEATSQSYPVRMPSIVSIGAALQAAPRLLLSVQGDYVRQSEIRSILAIRRAAVTREDYTLKDQLDVRAGAEVSLPVGDYSFQLRGGVLARGGAALDYQGDQEFERALFPAADDTITAFGGVSLVSRTGLRLDAALRGGQQRAIVVGGSVRF